MRERRRGGSEKKGEETGRRLEGGGCWLAVRRSVEWERQPLLVVGFNRLRISAKQQAEVHGLRDFLVELEE